jgi:hypothetical protein
VKNAIDIIPAIRTLSELANALSEEFEAEYALRTHFEVCQEIRKTSHHQRRRHIFYRKVIADLLRKMSDRIVQLIGDKERKLDHAKLISTIDSIAASLYEKLLEGEMKAVRGDARSNKFMYLETGTWEKALENLQVEDLTGAPPREQKEKLRMNIQKIRNIQKQLKEARALPRPVLVWIAVIGFALTVIGIILAIIFKIIPWGVAL